MSVGLQLLLAAASATLVAGSGCLVYQLFAIESEPRPSVGTRGAGRARSLHWWCFRVVEPGLRRLASWIRALPATRLRLLVDAALLRAGSPAGLSADEFLAASVVSAIVCASSASWVTAVSELPSEVERFLMPSAVLVGLLAPWSRLRALGRSRTKAIDLALPMAVDLASLCMGAGQDFVGSVRQIVTHAADPAAPLIVEFETILHQLHLGRTRRRALETFSSRVPTESVREFVNSVVQAERKGSPLAHVLAIQAQTQRLRRTLAAEELAAGAAVMLVGPMALIFLCVILLMLAPLAVRFMAGGFAR